MIVSLYSLGGGSGPLSSTASITLTPMHPFPFDILPQLKFDLYAPFFFRYVYPSCTSLINTLWNLKPYM